MPPYSIPNGSALNSAWQSGRPRSTQQQSRTPQQSRSTTASPAQQEAKPPPNNVWAQRGGATSNGPVSGSSTPANEGVGGFSAAEGKAFLGRSGGVESYRIVEGAAAGPGGGRSGGWGAAWGAKAGHMANGQPFFVQLAKQIAATEGGG